ncbi:hypothetical protein BDV38DRAFT_275530 [Aspergillus pseudotamarii]|uniref:Heterokaryon incompatibility domain-containing protein n=1 Tax=Aspergillus pseudotamarii TaxID=132259 RepID=A0A5N6SFP4_ASPPS|nr:uncharacterized protein BDV38DRAFT_275530 [Aspergillus pseudotamarii]KAE8131924.1 hypothetical protein BDV38DRAFT_275530 [Aspergillus pseudotamarii]
MTLGLLPPNERRDPSHELGITAYAVYESPDSRSPGFAGRNFSKSLEVNEDSGSLAAFNRARQWLSHCVQHDQACKPPDTEFMPRRLVNVGSWDGSRDSFLYEPTTPVIYASIQDAITVCRALKIPNLWVDSQCIVQDDKIAWLHDALTMHDPNSCKLRFLGKQQFGDPSWQRSFCPTLPDWPVDTSTELLMRPGEFKLRSNTERSSLDKQGWCLQESLLPNHRLCYDGKEMIWECLCRQTCECGHVVEPQIPRNTSKDYGKLGTTLKTHLPEAEPPLGRIDGFIPRHCSPPMIPYHRWRDLVTDYSHRSLSKRHDTLRGISALAKMIQNRLPEKDGSPAEYVAGLWKGELHFDLTWEVKPVDTHDVPPSTGLEDDNETNYRIPSWSWASIKVIDCKREVLEDPASAVIGGSLVLEGAFVPVNLVNENERKVAYVQSTCAQTLSISLDSPGLVASGDNQYYCFRLYTLTRFLVLGRSTYKEDAFERIGVGVWDDNFGGKRPCPLFVDVEPGTVERV